MSLGFRILGEAERETSNLLIFLPLKASSVHGQGCSAVLLHQVWWNSITKYTQFTPREIRGATMCSTSACTVQIWIVVSQFSSTRSTADKGEEWWSSEWNFEEGESPGWAWIFPWQLSHPGFVSGGRGTSMLAAYVTFDFGWCSSFPSFHRMVAQMLKATALPTLLYFFLWAGV